MLSLVSLCWSLHQLLSLVLVWFSARVPAVSMIRRLSSFSLSRIVYGFRCRSVVLSSDHCSCYVLSVVWVLDSLLWAKFPGILRCFRGFGFHPCMFPSFINQIQMKKKHTSPINITTSFCSQVSSLG